MGNRGLLGSHRLRYEVGRNAKRRTKVGTHTHSRALCFWLTLLRSSIQRGSTILHIPRFICLCALARHAVQLTGHKTVTGPTTDKYPRAHLRTSCAFGSETVSQSVYAMKLKFAT